MQQTGLLLWLIVEVLFDTAWFYGVRCSFPPPSVAHTLPIIPTSSLFHLSQPPAVSGKWSMPLVHILSLHSSYGGNHLSMGQPLHVGTIKDCKYSLTEVFSTHFCCLVKLSRIASTSPGAGMYACLWETHVNRLCGVETALTWP